MKARIYPAIISILPVLLLFNFWLHNLSTNSILYDVATKIISNITISAVLVYFLSQLNRFISKELFEKKLFKNEYDFPTTTLLLSSSSELSTDYKNKLRTAIYDDYKINLLDEELEKNNLPEYQRKIIEAVGLIRSKIKDGNLLLQHNIEYGFVRNLIGGSFLGLCFSMLDIIFFLKINYNLIMLLLSASLFLFYTIVLLSNKFVLGKYGMNYTKILYREYLSYRSEGAK